MLVRHSIIFTILVLAGCGGSGPATTHTNSSKFKTMKEKTDFLHQYVTFRRTYETLDFDISCQNNGGGLPGPSDHDIRVVATVPTSEIQAWVPTGLQPSPQDQDWLKSVPTSLDLSGMNERYGDIHRIVGIDREKRIVVYRNEAH